MDRGGMRFRGHLLSVESSKASQKGEMLVETMLTLLIVAIVVPAILLLATVLNVSAQRHRQAIDARNVATTLAEAIDAMDYVPSCDPLSAYSSQLEPVASHYNSPDLRVRFQSPTSMSSPEIAFQDSCIPGGDRGTQEITIKVSTRSNTASGTVILIKRNDECVVNAPVKAGEKC